MLLKRQSEAEGHTSRINLSMKSVPLSSEAHVLMSLRSVSAMRMHVLRQPHSITRHIYMRARAHTHTHTHTHMYIYTGHIYMHMCVCVCVYVYTYMYA